MAREDEVRLLLLTPRGPGGLAVVALAGANRTRVAAAILGDDRGPGGVVDEVPRLRWLWLDGAAIDQVLAFERADRGWVEMHLHASAAVLRRIEGALRPMVAPAWPPAETLLRVARDPRQLACALEQRALLAPWSGDFAAWVAAHRLDPLALANALARSEAGVAHAQPCALVLCGRKNAGKSTLMNRLLFHERVLTGPEPGLTRDPVGEPVILDGYPYELVDTAGEGEAVDAIDARAMQLGRARRAHAWRLILIDSSAGAGDVEARLIAESPNHLVVETKIDLAAGPWSAKLPSPHLRLSCLDPSQAPSVRSLVGAALRRRRHLPPAGRLGGVAAICAEQLARLRAAVALSSPPGGAT